MIKGRQLEIPAQHSSSVKLDKYQLMCSLLWAHCICSSELCSGSFLIAHIQRHVHDGEEVSTPSASSAVHIDTFYVETLGLRRNKSTNTCKY